MLAYLRQNDVKTRHRSIRRLGLLLIDGFALMSYASIVEPFRAANDLAGEALYRWTHISQDGAQVSASNGASVLADQAVGHPLQCDTLFVFAGGDPSTFADRKTFSWLRRLSRAGVRIAGVSGGPFLLARAGLLDGYRSTIHWSHREAFANAFPTLVIAPDLYVIDRNRLTCAGGTAGLDLSIELIEREHGHDLAAGVSEWFIRTDPRPAEKSQRLTLRERFGINDERILKVLAEMEVRIERPATAQDLSRLAGLSLRQLQRVFLLAVGESLARCYLRIRLTKAAELLRSSSMPMVEVGVACGFQSSAHFARCFKAQFGHSPRLERKRS
jgi:transcriptional regulator GlxA family with amidase domain